jgi:hypothetical protein
MEFNKDCQSPSFIQLLCQPRQHVAEIVFDFLVAEAYDFDTHHVDDKCSEFIMVFVVVVNFAIDLHNQLPFITKEISDEESLLTQIIEEKRVLAVKLQAQELSVSHGFPENLFSVGLALP